MLYSAGLEGHRQLYCDVLTDILLELGYRVLLVVGLGQPGFATTWRHITRYKDHPAVKILDTFSLSSTGKLSVEQIVKLQDTENVAASFFTCADELRTELTQIATGVTPRFKGRTIGIFGWTQYWYPIEFHFSSRRGIRALRSYVHELRGYLLRHRADVHFYENMLPQSRVLDTVFVKDERIVAAKGTFFRWLPDIYKPFNWPESKQDELEYNEIVPPYKLFLDQHRTKQVLLYFGTAEAYKGYDILLRLAVSDTETCFVHCGAHNPKVEGPLTPLQDELRSQGRIFETGRFMQSQRAIDEFLNSVRYFVSTHRVYFSSGTMLQALDAGKPVLVPNAGALAHRTLRNHLGSVYKPQNFADLCTKWNRLKHTPSNSYSVSIGRYMQNYTREGLKGQIEKALS